MSAPAGRLLVVATPIGNLGDLSPRARRAMAEAEVVACEDTRHTGTLLQATGISAKRLVSLHEHNEASRVPALVELMGSGATVALVSDAGTPLISDPGSRLVAATISAGLAVEAIPGPSALLAALVVSGLDVSRFRFEGFLARKGPERRAAIERLAVASEPSVCYESPQRVAATLAELAEHCGPGRRVVVARELTKRFEETWRGTLAEAVAWAQGRPGRGEYVLVVDGRSADRAATPDEELALLAGRLVAAGLRRKDAAVALEVLLGVPHRAAYGASLAAGGDEGASKEGPVPPVR